MYYRLLKKKSGGIRYLFEVRVPIKGKRGYRSATFDTFTEGAKWWIETKKEIEELNREPTLLKRIEVLEEKIESISLQIEILTDQIRLNLAQPLKNHHP